MRTLDTTFRGAWASGTVGYSSRRVLKTAIHSDRTGPRLLGRSLIVAVVLLVLTPTSQGWSAGPSRDQPPDTSAVTQYVEVVPTGGGDVPSGSSTAGSTRLSPKADRSLRRLGGADAAKLIRLATSPALGAPVADRGSVPDADGTSAGVVVEQSEGRLLSLLGSSLRSRCSSSGAACTGTGIGRPAATSPACRGSERGRPVVGLRSTCVAALLWWSSQCGSVWLPCRYVRGADAGLTLDRVDQSG